MSTQEINFDLTQYPTLREFAYDDNSLVKCVIGPAGSAKTSYIMIEALRRACMQAPAADGVRYFKVLVIRNTYALLTKSTLDTAKRMIGGVTKFKDSPPPSGHARFDLADGTQVDFRMEFMSIDGEDAQSQLLGYEPTMVFIDEISELPESLVHAVIRRLGRYPSGNLGTPTWTGVVAATNGPMKSHWLYRWFLGKFDAVTQGVIDTVEAESGRRFFRLFKQPAALLRERDEDGREKWVPNPLAENVRNLPGGYSYYYQMLLDSNEQKIKAYVEGDFADIVTGKLVFPEFSRERHIVSHLDIDINGINQVYLSFDFGRTPVCLFFVATLGGRIIFIDEVMGEDTSIDALFTEKIHPLLAQKYRHMQIAGAWGDPAGATKTQAVELSPYDVLLDHGVPIADPGGGNRMEPRLEGMRQYLQRIDSHGRPMLTISDNCPYLIESLAETYIYERVPGQAGMVRDNPTKSHVNWTSDLADACQYAVLGYNRLAGRAERRKHIPPARKRNWF